MSASPTRHHTPADARRAASLMLSLSPPLDRPFFASTGRCCSIAPHALHASASSFAARPARHIIIIITITKWIYYYYYYMDLSISYGFIVRIWIYYYYHDPYTDSLCLYGFIIRM